MEAMDPRGAISRSHDETGDYLLCLGDISGTWLRYLNVFLPYSSTLWLLAALVLVSNPLPSWYRMMFGTGTFERDGKRVLLVC